MATAIDRKGEPSAADVTPKRYDDTRESWLEAFACILVHVIMIPAAESIGVTLPELAYRVGIGEPLGARGGRKRIGECWDDSVSGDRVHMIWITPRLQPGALVTIVATLLHELIHAAVGIPAGHGAPFRRLAEACGLEGKMTATVPGEDLKRELAAILKAFDPYPQGTWTPIIRKQGTYLLKSVCPVDGCGFLLRITSRWINAEGYGHPLCPRHKTQMVDG